MALLILLSTYSRPLIFQQFEDFEGVELSNCQTIGSEWDIAIWGALKHDLYTQIKLI